MHYKRHMISIQRLAPLEWIGGPLMMMNALVNRVKNARNAKTIPHLIAARMNALAILMRNVRFVVC